MSTVRQKLAAWFYIFLPLCYPATTRNPPKPYGIMLQELT
ncbi:hypothetical protein GGQ86_000004 [Xanthobacter flavus]|uniref:Uncharacterized protein n=1 Tax=Xanthobacter flavus TaxID=281 RepID=A0ABU1K9P1_XANFL|nr:hypothetical protein [Xanthobacter flavus]MDR6331557.1 hypothetical protein [Xanthobacter flavus]